ncbi:hypothetical protein B0T18DRAFT_431749 [Schizothecium vesticola]|uniref:Uncharacterized protein n=1 Tax=Schizothecium vesticola TaxID=314040 RepID=A0AA40EJD7_9PEZI|nr:hypothetical protein B0T18DRAFT_431749 [Schizothecium vesticola]
MRPSTILPTALVAASAALAQSTVTYVSVISSTTNGLSTSTATVAPTTTTITSIGSRTGTATTTAVVVTQTRSPGERAAAVEKPVLGLVAACAVGVMVL